MATSIPLTGNWITGPEAARIAGISPNALAMRRLRETQRRTHPRYIALSRSSVLYEESAFREYVDQWHNMRRIGGGK